MKTRLLGVLAVSAIAGLLSGCTSFRSSVPEINVVPMGAISTAATYDIIGEAVGTVTGRYILGCIPWGIERKVGFIVDSGMGGRRRPAIRTRIQSWAIYEAIESVQGADAIITPRWHVESTRHIFSRTIKVTLRGKAVRFNVSAK